MAAVTMNRTNEAIKSKQSGRPGSRLAPGRQQPEVTMEQAPTWLERWLPRLIAPWGTSLLLWMSFFPLALGFFAWVALVPLLCLVRREISGKRAFWLAYLAGAAFFWPILQWMRVADYRMYYAWGLLATYVSFYFPVAIILLRRIERTRLMPIWLSLPIVWVGLEYVRSFALTGFAWYYLAHTQHDVLQLIQISDLGGAYLVSFLVAAVNGLLFDMLCRVPEFRRFFALRPPDATPRWHESVRGPIIGFCVVVAGLLATLWYGHERLNHDRFMQGPRVALLQGNIPQDIRNLIYEEGGGEKIAKAIAGQYTSLKSLSYDRSKGTPELMPDLVVWPETSYPATWAEDNLKVGVDQLPDAYKWQVNYLRQVELPGLVKESPTHHLLGMVANIYDDEGNPTQRNSAVFIDPRGNRLARYDKIHAVPFGEYVPFKDSLPFLRFLAPYDWDYGIIPGTTYNRMYLPERSSQTIYRFGVIICYEDTDPVVTRQYGRDHADGPPVDFLVNISNDGWFKGTSEHEEHLAISRFRAIENRRAVVRSVNMGISAVIDPDGRVQMPFEITLRNQEELRQRYGINAKLWMVRARSGKVMDLPVSEWHKFKKVDGVLHATVPIDNRTSYYALYGDWLPVACWAVIAGLLLYRYLRRRLHRDPALA